MKNKRIFLIILLVACITFATITTSIVSAALFGGDSVCRPQWYCTTYSKTDCGNRTCIDVNACGSNFNKPQEFTLCENASDSKTTSKAITNMLPKGYFTVDTEVVKLSVEQETVVQKIITLNSTAPEEYFLEIDYPSSYTKGTDFFTTSQNKKYIDNSGDFNIILDTRNIAVGTYVIPIKVYNQDYSRIILAIVDVIPKKNPQIDLKIDSPVKTSGVDKEIIVELHVKGITLVSRDNLTYEIIDPKGNILTQEDKTIENPSIITDRLTLPTNTTEGYYTLSIKIEDASGVYTKSTTFTILAPDKYIPIIEQIPKTHYITIIIIVLLIIIGIIIAIYNTSLFYNTHRFGKRYRYSKTARGITMFKLSVGKPVIRINFGSGEGLRKIKEKFNKNTLITDPNKRLDLLKKSYERGFISLKEYRDSLKEQGFKIESNSVAEYYDEMKNKERIEGMSKRTDRTDDVSESKSAESKYAEELKIKEEQKKNMEKAERAVIKQEEELRKEIEQEKILKEKKIEEEKLKEKEAKEKEIKEEIKEIKYEVAEAKESHEVLTQQTKVSEPTAQPETKVILTPVSHIISKENVLDKRANDNQTFILNSGEKLYCIRDILNILPHMHEQVFNHHTKHGRNDFANWIGDVFQYYDVAEKVRDADTKEELIKVLKEFE